MKSKMKIGVIVSTYNSPELLEKTLYGYSYQIRPADEIIIADDGSSEETKFLIEKFADLLPIKHIWHEDIGFSKNIILNKALIAAQSEYLIFTDQDCIPKKDFVQIHEKYAKTGCFLSGSYNNLNEALSKKITKYDISLGRAFNFAWLCRNGIKISANSLRIIISGYNFLSRFLDSITPYDAIFKGCNASCFKDDALFINGFNEGMTYGGEDKEFGVRLSNAGIKRKHIRFSTVLLHLYHDKPYADPVLIAQNKTFRHNVKKQKITKTPNGIEKLDADVLNKTKISTR